MRSYWDDEMTDSQALQSFVWFAELAAMEDTFLLQLEEDARAQAPAFEDIKQSLERQLNRNKWLHWILIAVGASVAVAGTIVFRLRRSMQQRKSKAVETVINSPRLNRPIQAGGAHHGPRHPHPRGVDCLWAEDI